MYKSFLRQRLCLSWRLSARTQEASYAVLRASHGGGVGPLLAAPPYLCSAQSSTQPLRGEWAEPPLEGHAINYKVDVLLVHEGVRLLIQGRYRLQGSKGNDCELLKCSLKRLARGMPRKDAHRCS